MKIKYLYINGYKNLKNLEIHFDEGSTVNAIIGNNGSGKSNILEAVTIIFSNVLESSNDIGFEFCIKYSIYESVIEINNITGELKLLKNNKKVSRKYIISIIPKAIFLYYAGETKRLRRLSEKCVDKRFEKILKRDEDIALKFLTYLSVDDFGAALLTNYIYQNETYNKICKLVGIKELCSPITVNLHRPIWGKNGNAENFWNAIGTVKKELSNLAQLGEYEIIDSNNSNIVIHDITKLKDESIGAIGLFTIFKVLVQADILENIEFDVVQGNKKFSYMNLSEGEKQLGQLLSILEITKEYKALFLLDEFDSYLHPNWQREFVDVINGIDIRGQILFTTHSPLTLGKMKKENILRLKNGVIYNPSSETFNRDITEVLEELMDVKKRPVEIEEMMFDFRNSIIYKDIEKATEVLDKLKEVLSKEDPFLNTAKISITRLGR